MRQRLPLVLSATALVIALFGSTPLGHAVTSAVPPFAKHAKTADYATNAGAVNGFKASKRPRVGWLVPLGKGGKFPVSVGQVGPVGPVGPAGPQGNPGPQGLKGDAGLQGNPGVSGRQIVITSGPTGTSQGIETTDVYCPTGKKVIGGGGIIQSGGGPPIALTESFPTPGAEGWRIAAQEIDPYAGNWSLDAYAVCANVTG